MERLPFVLEPKTANEQKADTHTKVEAARWRWGARWDDDGV